MALFLITGLPGTGKTTVCNELKARGLTAYDGDKDHLAHWYDKKTGEEAAYDGTREFIDRHHRSIAKETIERLAHDAVGKSIFLCNDPDNEDELQGFFTHVFALTAGEAIIRQRLADRTGDGYEWGKIPHELAAVLETQEVAYRRYKQDNYTVIDATLPTNIIVDRILKR